MYTLNVRNVNHLLPTALALFHHDGVATADDTVRLPLPISIYMTHPHERVPMPGIEGTNPFMLLAEALWFVTCRPDYTKLEAMFDEKSLRITCSIEERNHLVRMLKSMGESSSIMELERGISIAFRKHRNVAIQAVATIPELEALHGTCTKATACISMMLEFVARSTGYPVGSLHLMVSNAFIDEAPVFDPPEDPYLSGAVEPTPIMSIRSYRWDREALSLLGGFVSGKLPNAINDPFLAHVALPVLQAWKAYRAGDVVEARRFLGTVAASDWATACTNWLEAKVKA